MKKNSSVIPKWPWKMKCWEERVQAIARMIPYKLSVIELGGGFCRLAEIRPDLAYRSVDIEAWTDVTDVADFNKGEFPDYQHQFDIILCQGIIEYMVAPVSFLCEVGKYGKSMIITYYIGKSNLNSRENHFSFEEFERILKLSGWEIELALPFSSTQKIYRCGKKI